MSVARNSGPKLLDAALRTTQQPVDVEPVGIGGDLRRDPGGQPSERLGQRALHPEDALEGSEAYLHLLADWWATVRLLGGRRNIDIRKLICELCAAVCQISQEPTGDDALIETCSGQKLPHQEHIRDVGGCKLVGDGHAVGRADEVQLHPVESERSPPNPRSSLETRRLGNLTRVQYFQERRVYEEGLGLSDQLGQHCAAQGFQKTPELPHPPMQRGGMQPSDPGEQVREEPLGIAQEGSLTL